jgi:hypothetical protein
LIRYLEIVFRSKLRLLALILVFPLAFTAVDFYLWRTYDTSELVWVDDPGTFGQGTASALGFDPYSTPSQNFARLFSNLIGTQSFNEAVADKLMTTGAIHTTAERTALITSLAQLTVSPGRVTGSGGSQGSSGGGGGANGDHIITIRFICKKEALCLAVLSAVLDVFRAQYSDLKARSAATARAIYVANLKQGQADLAAATSAIEKYEASKPKSTKGAPQNTQDPILTGLQHQLDSAQKEVDNANAQILQIDTISQITAGITNDLSVIDQPQTKGGLFGVRGLGNDNLKADAIALACCLIAAAAYLVLVAFLDRTVRDANQISARLQKPVIAIPDYTTRRPQRRKATVSV